MNWDRTLPVLLGVAVLGAVGAAIGFAVLASTTLPDGPVEVVWDKAACAHCSMHLGEPAFAAQLTTTAGQTLFFDDPGCLFEHVAAARPDVHATWFRHLREERWLPAAAAGFVAVDHSPMGFGLGAVDAGAPGAMSLAQATVRCLGPRDGAAASEVPR
jgi:hypothetical protein